MAAKSQIKQISLRLEKIDSVKFEGSPRNFLRKKSEPEDVVVEKQVHLPEVKDTKMEQRMKERQEHLERVRRENLDNLRQEIKDSLIDQTKINKYKKLNTKVSYAERRAKQQQKMHSDLLLNVESQGKETNVNQSPDKKASPTKSPPKVTILPDSPVQAQA